jgi:hypothetical protein
MSNDILIHHGSKNKKRISTKCGLPPSESDSVRPSEVTCIKCVKAVMKLGVSNWESWSHRLKKLEASDKAGK